MGKKTDWMSGTRSGQLATAKNWVMILKDKGKVWNVLADETTELTSLTDDADEALAVAKNETTRTPVATAQCRTAFDALTAKMRDIKKRYFYVPPLTQADLVSLGLHPHDATPSHSGIPTAQVMVETYLIGRHELGVHIVYVAGDPNDKANKGYRIWYAVVAPGETPPVDPEQLTKSLFTKRKKDVIEFGYGDSGNTAYFAVQIENDGKKGTWGPLVNALIP